MLKIIKKNGDYSVISASLVLLNKENSDKMVCDGIIEDITLNENEKLQTRKLIAELKTNDLILGQPVKDQINPICTWMQTQL